MTPQLLEPSARNVYCLSVTVESLTERAVPSVVVWNVPLPELFCRDEPPATETAVCAAVTLTVFSSVTRV